MVSAMKFEMIVKGPFDLKNQSLYFGGYPQMRADPDSIVMAFPVEGWEESAAVMLRQSSADKVEGEVYGAVDNAARAWNQAMATLSLDVDGRGWPEVGGRDKVIGGLQSKYQFLRPLLFSSPYESAAGFLIGHRITIKQKQVIMSRMSRELGKKIEVRGEPFYAFPDPHAILSIEKYDGLDYVKIERLHALALAALNGSLERAYLRSLEINDALTKLKELPGIGSFFAEGILHRGAGLVDAITHDDLTPYAIEKAYVLPQQPSASQIDDISRRWEPFRMWALVLLHVWLRREIGLPRRPMLRRK
jgi:DNA-3-methyladenine glycosylase II